MTHDGPPNTLLLRHLYTACGPRQCAANMPLVYCTAVHAGVIQASLSRLQQLQNSGPSLFFCALFSDFQQATQFPLNLYCEFIDGSASIQVFEVL